MVMLQGTFAYHENGTGIVINSTSNASITMSNVTATGRTDDGIYIKLYQASKVNLTDIDVSNSSDMCLHLICKASSDIHINGITAKNCGFGIAVDVNDKSNLMMSHATSSNCPHNGIFLTCYGSGNNLYLFNISSVHNFFNGIAVKPYSDGNKFYFNKALASYNTRVGLHLECATKQCNVWISNALITNNFASGLQSYGPWIINFTNESSTISNNSNRNGGGMCITGLATITGAAEVLFINNTAKGMGGAIFANEFGYSDFMLTNYYTFKFFAPVFQNNSALIAGDNIYNGVYDKFNMPFLHNINCSSSQYLSNFQTPLSSYITSVPMGVCMCDKDLSVNCMNRSFDIVLYPGQSITLPLVTVGACGGTSPSVLVISNTSGVEVVPAESNQETVRKCKNFTYTINQPNSFITGGKVYYGIRTAAVNVALEDSKVTMSVRFQQCPHGLHVVSGSCQCDNIIGAVNGTQCDINMMPHPISRSSNNWLYYSEDYHCVVAHKNCPFDYCNASTIYLNLNESDLQCTNGRSGILCGGCQPGLSLTLGSNKCEQCSNKYLSLVAAFFLAGLALVIFLLVSNLTVSLGSINGLLFYANVIKLNEAVLFPNGVSIPVLSQFIAWLNLDLGIQTCFFNGLDGYWKTWLQFAFPLYIWLLIGGVIIGCYYSGRLARLCGNNAVPVLATLIFMSYTKLLRVITNILMLAVIRCKDTHWLVWSVDGNIGYLSSKHIPLFVIAMVFVFLGLVYTVLVFSAQWLQRYSGKCFKSSRDPVVKLKPFIDAYTGPYKDKYRYWTGLLLIVRLLLTTVFSYTTGIVPQINNYIIAVVTAVLLYLSRGVYRDRKLDMLEAFYLINLFVMAQLNTLSYVTILHITSTTVTAVSISLSLAAFVCMIAFGIFTQIKAKYGLHFCTNKRLEIRAEEEEPLLNDDLHSPSRIVMRRESLIFDFNI